MPRDSSGIRLRGLAMTRIETFTDAAFAFSLTLLVISMDPPSTMATLDAALRGIPAFVLSASLLMMFWSGHHNWSRRFGLDDGTTIVLSCLLVFTTLVYVYPLRFMLSSMMSWLGGVTDLPLGAPRSALGIRRVEDVNRMFAIYGVGFTAMSSAIMLLNAHAWRCREALHLDALELEATKSEIGAWAILTGSGVASTVVALLFPHDLPFAGWAYTPLAVIMPWYGVRARRRAQAIQTDTESAAGDRGAVFAGKVPSD